MNGKYSPYVIVALLLLLVAGVFWWAGRAEAPMRPGTTTTPDNTTPTTTANITNFRDCVEAGYEVAESYPAICRMPDGRTFTEDIGNAADKQNLIRVTSPVPNSTIASPITVTGQARGNWFFEASFPVKVIDDSGRQLGVGIATAQGDWMTTEFVPFQAVVQFTTPTTRYGTLILEKDNPSGLPQNADSLRIPVVFRMEQEMSVQVFFQNTVRDPNMIDCSKTYPVTRVIPQTAAVGRAALEELLKGPTESEKDEGYATSINSAVTIQRLVISSGVATVDLSSELEQGVGGSCRVAAIRAQIEDTLKQFPTVRSVVISVNGRVDDVLQP